MSHRHHLQGFKKEIRRQQLDQIFHNKRRKVLNQEEAEMQIQPCEIRKQQLYKMDLKSLAKICQGRSGCEIVIKSDYAANIIKYFHSNYLNTQQQNYASYILSNLTVFMQKPLPINYYSQMLQLLQQTPAQKTAQNIIDTIANSIDTDAQVKKNLIIHFQLVNRIIAILQKYQQHYITFTEAISNCIIHMLKDSQPDKSFKKLRPYLLRFLQMPPKQQNLRIIKQSAFSLYLLTKKFPTESLDTLIKSRMFERLIQLFDTTLMGIFVNVVFKIASSVVQDFKMKDFKQIVIKLIEKLSAIQFSVKNFSYSNIKNLKKDAYILISLGLENSKIDANQLMSSQLGNKLIQQFLIQEDRDLRRQFVFMFTNVYLQSSNPIVKDKIRNGMARAKHLDCSQMDIVAHISQFQSLK